MFRTKKFILGTMLVTAGLLAGNVSANAQGKKLETKDKTKKEILNNTEKRFEDEGFLIIVRGKELIFNYDIEKITPKAKARANDLNKFVSGLIKDYPLDSDNPYNIDYFSQKNLDFMINSVNEANRFVVDSLLGLPLSNPKYEATKHYLMAMFVYIEQNKRMLLELSMKIPKNISTEESMVYRQFVNFAMRIAFMKIVIEKELEELSQTKNLLTQKTRQK